MDHEDKFQKLQTLQADVEAKFLQIGKLIHELLAAGVPAAVIAARMSRHVRTVYHYCNAHVAVLNKHLTRAEAIRLGYAKAFLFAHTPLTVSIEVAVSMSASALAKTLLTSSADARKACVFMLTDAEQQTLNMALSEYGAIRHGRGLRLKEQALMTILVRAMAAQARPKKLLHAA